MHKHFDIIITGSGPAGSTAALALKDSGFSVAVVDKENFPRDKTCGDAIGGRAIRVLKNLDPILANQLSLESGNISTGWRLYSPSGKSIDASFIHTGIVLARERFDYFLHNGWKSACPDFQFIQGKVHNVSNSDASICIRLDSGELLSARLLIACDGAQSVAAKKLSSLRVNHLHYSGAVRGYFKDISGAENSGLLEIHLVRNYLPGYFWIFPMGNALFNVGFGMLSRDISKRKIDLKKAFYEIIETPFLEKRFSTAELCSELKGFGLPLGGIRKPISGERFMLCGDAASLIDPLTGEGIGNAMLSGNIAAMHAIACFHKNDFSGKMMGAYDKAVYKKLLPELRKNLVLQRLFNRPWLIETLVSIGTRFPWIKDKIAAKL